MEQRANRYSQGNERGSASMAIVSTGPALGFVSFTDMTLILNGCACIPSIHRTLISWLRISIIERRKQSIYMVTTV